MELKLVRAFVVLAESLHFGRGAERLGIAQPQLSLQIQALEASLGVKLFERSRRHVALTEAGQAFLPDAAALLAQAERARAAAQRAARGETGRLEIAFTASAPFSETMPGLIGRFRARWPDLLMSLREMTTNDQLRALSENVIDIGFVRPGRPSETPGITLLTLLDEPLLAALPADHELAGRDRLAIAELARQPFIFNPRHIGTGHYDKVMSLCLLAGFTPRVIVEAHQMSTVVSLAAAGVGVAIVPAAMRRFHVEGVRFLALTDAGATLPLALAHRSDERRPAVLHFLEAATGKG